MSEHYHRIHIRMTKKQYENLHIKSEKAGMTMNKYLINELVTKYQISYPFEKIEELIAHMDSAGQEINETAHAFNAGYGTDARLGHCVALMKDVFNHAVQVRCEKEQAEQAWIKETGYIQRKARPRLDRRHYYRPSTKMPDSESAYASRHSRFPHKDNSKYITVRLNDEQYALLKKYRELTNFTQTLYFRKLIDGDAIAVNYFKYGPKPFAVYNMIYSNIRQIARAAPKQGANVDSVNQLVFLRDKLGDEINALTHVDV